jgi:hypothetical protein
MRGSGGALKSAQQIYCGPAGSLKCDTRCKPPLSTAPHLKTATVGIPKRLAVVNTRHAISPLQVRAQHSTAHVAALGVGNTPGFELLARPQPSQLSVPVCKKLSDTL